MTDDNDLIKNVFLDESEEQLQYMQDDVLLLEEKFDPEVMGRVFRAFHTMKSSASLLGFDNLATFAHRVEDLLSDLRQAERVFPKGVVNALLAALDAVNAVLDDVREGGDDGRDLSAAMTLVTSAREGGGSNEVKPAPASVPPSRPASAERKLKVLVVEDDFTSRNILQMFFARQYGACHVAKDGLEAIQAFTHAYDQEPPEPYHLICMDINMPQMDGLTATRTIREIERGKGVEGTLQESVILITSVIEDTDDIVQKSYRFGANYYLTKPIDLGRLQEQIRNFKLG